MAQAIPVFTAIQNPGAQTTSKEVKSEKKTEFRKEDIEDKNKKDSFAREVEKARESESDIKQTSQEKISEHKLLRFISDVVKKIAGKVKGPVKKKLFAFVKNLLEHTQFSDKEKGDLLSALLKKLEKKNEIDEGLINALQALIASPDKNKADTKNQDPPFKAVLGLINEKNVKLPDLQKPDSLPKLVVIDLRKDIKNTQKESKVTDQSKATGNSDQASKAMLQKSEGSSQQSSQHVFYVSSQGDGTIRQQETTPGVINKAPAGLDQEMVQKLKASLESEMVKHTKIIIKQGGAGEIRIDLKPESLGRIRMRVLLQNNHIDGKIFVENNSIKGIVETSLQNLNTALKQEGYDSVSLHVSVGDGNPQNQQGKPDDYIPYAEAVEEFDKNVDVLFDPGIQFARVNLVV
ncbi:MAG: flagellar hook-length control protein FliK [Spirochaetales bacterium]|nr:flagellar hook-length control protein FliK [Spirochaetales bacterium]